MKERVTDEHAPDGHGADVGQRIDDTTTLQQEFAERLTLCMGDTPVAKYARQCEISESLLRKYLAGRALPGTDKLIRLAQGSNASLDWLVSGRGTRERALAEQVTAFSGAGDQPMVYPPHLNPPDRGTDQDSRAVTFGFHAGWVKRALGCDPDDLAVFTVGGDAMAPSLHEGDLVLVDTRNSSHTDDTLYLIRRQGHMVVKRVQRQLNGDLLVRSDNAAYADERVTAAAIGGLEIIGRVVWSSGVV